MDNNFVLAMYDVRGKQNYIFRSKKLKEIVGASLIIRDVYKDYLLSGEVAEEYPIYISDKPLEDDFSREKTIEHLSDRYVGEVVYEGGGNFNVLFRNKEVFEEVTHAFTKKVLEELGSLRVIGTCVENVDFDDFRDDRTRLYEAHRITENTVQNVPPFASLPIVMVDPNSHMPIVERSSKDGELTNEVKAKRAKFVRESQNSPDEVNEKILDNIAPEKGVDSHIAIIYIDGNNMGQKVQECIGDKKTYEECIKSLRKFSADIQNEFIDSKISVIDKCMNDKNAKRRLVLGAGDEINVIVPAKDAFVVAKDYLMNLDNGFSSCVGVAVFKSHMPYADAYRVAEECCESAKDKMKACQISNASLIDFHYCQGAIDTMLEQVREDEELTDISRPWIITIDENEKSKVTDIVDVEIIEKMRDFLNSIGHSNVKGLLEPAKNSDVALEMELKRIKAHQSEKVRDTMIDDWKWVEDMDEQVRRKVLYDMVLMYDLWFMKVGNK